MLDGIVGLFFGGGLYENVFIPLFIPPHTFACTISTCFLINIIPLFLK
jgi:hypothetical protein